MKKETEKQNKKSKLWLWILLALLALAIIGGVVAAFVLPGLMQPQGPTGPVAEAKLYWNLDRTLWVEEETNMSAREKAEDGYYHIRFAFDGKVEELKITDDKRLVNYLDSQDVICLAFDENGIVVDCAPASTYFTPAAKELYTKRVQNNILQLNSSMAMNGMDMEFDISGIPVYEVSEGSEEKGSLITPQWLDVVTVYNDLEGNSYAAYVTGHLAIDAEVAWRVEYSMYSASTGYKRVPDKDGVYTIPFAINGEIVNRYIKNYDMAISIENQSMYSSYFALEYDEDGYIIDWENPAMALQGVQLCQAFNVDSVTEDGFVTATRYLTGNNQGETVTFTYDDTCEIYQCCIGGCYHKHCGERIDSLQVGDMINVFTDLDGKPILIYVSIRTVDSPTYYNIQQKYSWSTLESNRTTDEDGYYVFEMAVNGGTKTVRTKSKEIADIIDGNHNRAMGLKLSGSVIKEVYGVQCVSGRGIAFGGRFVTSYNKPIVSVAATSDITNVSNWVMTDNCKIYTVDENFGVKLGSKASIKVGDKVLALQNAKGELCYIYVQQTYQPGFKMGYNMARKYSTVTNSTTRIPNAEDYYVYDVAYNGKVIQLKTKNKAIADFIDLQNAPVFGFKEKNGIITDVCTAASAVPYGQKAYNYNNIDNMNGGILTSWYMSGGVRTMGTAQWKITSKTKTYNVSKGYEDHPGEKSKPKVGDKIQAIVNTATGAIEYIFIMNRPVDSPIYWMVSRVAPRYVDGVLAGSNRVPDEDGYYVIDLLCDGKIKQYKTKDEMIAAEVDTYTQGLGLKLKEGTNIIERVVAVADTKYPNTAIGNADVVSIKGNTLKTKRCRLTASNYGEELTVKLSSKVKIYNVSTYAEKFGAADKLEKGDRIVAYTNLDGEIAYIFITKAAAREKGSWGYCDHCGKTVFWDSYSEIFAADGHYYLPTDLERGTITFGSTTDDVVYDQVFDLNGHSLKSTASAFTVNDKLTIIDSAGGGKVTNGKGISFNGSKQGGNIFVAEGGTFTLLSGTIENGAVGLTGVGSNISTFNGTVNIKGGTISGGVGYLGTAVYHGGAKGGINISGGKLAGSVFAEESKMITLSGKPVIEKLIVAPGNLVKLGALKSGAKITVKGDGIFTTESADIKTLKNYFVPANSKDTITISGKALKYNNLSGEQVIPEPESPNKPLELDKNGMGQCILCGEKVQWTALHEGDVIGDMNPAHEEYNAELFGGAQKHFHYYIAEDMTAGDGDFLYTWQGKGVCLHLNGKTLNIRSGFYGGNGATINIYGDGKVHFKADATKSYTAGNMFEIYTASVNIYGGEFTTETNMIHGAGAACMLSISDEAIINGNVKMDYGNVSISGGVNIKRIALGETAKLTVSKLFKGTASLSVAAGLEEGNLIPEANAAVLGKYTGKLTYVDFRDIVYSNGRLKVVGEAPSPNEPLVLDENDMGICYVCGEKVQWIALRGGDVIGDVHSDGQRLHYYVAEDMTAADGNFQFIRDKSENVAAKATATVCLHLNGKLLNVRGVIEGGHGANVNIMGDGKITNGGAKELFQLYTANLTLYGGEYFGCGYPVFNSLGEAAKVTVTGDAKLYGDAKLPYGAMILKENGRVDNIELGNSVVQRDTNGDGTPDDVTVYGKVTVGANWAGMAKLTVDAANMDGKLIKAESGVAQGDFTGVLINQDSKKFVNSEGLLKLTSKTGSIPAAPAAPKAPAVATPPVPEGINDNLVLDSENKAMCAHCGEEVVWIPVGGSENVGTVAANNNKLHFYLTEDNNSNGRFFANDAGTGSDTICLHLNGHNLTTKNGFVLRNNSKFNLMGNGNVSRTDGGLLFDIWTCVVNIYGGNYTSGTIMKTSTANSVVSILGDTKLNGLVEITAGRTYFAHNASAEKVAVSGSGKLQLANNWNGTMEISVADSLMEGNLVKESAVELIGAVNGTITHAEGIVTVVDGRLCITLPEPETPVWGVFNPEACGNKAYCPACGEAAGVIEWTKISSASDVPGYMADEVGLNSDVDNDGTLEEVTDKHYYLANDITYVGGSQWIGLHGVGGCIHLNGHTLSSAARIFGGGTGAYMNIIAGDGGAFEYTGAYHQGGIVTSVPTNLYGGTYTSTQATDAAVYKPIIQVTGNTTTLHNATVNGRVEIAGGTITVSGTTSATNVAIDTYLSDAATGATKAANGKLVIAEGWSGNLVLTLKSDDIVSGLIKTSRAVVNGDFTGTIKMADGRNVVKEGNRLKVEGNAPALPDINADLELDGDKATCPKCNQEVTWTALHNGESLANLTAGTHHVYLAEDVTAASGKFLPDLGAGVSLDICFHLNGHNVTINDYVYCGRQWNINVMGNGKMINANASNPIFVVYTSNVNLYGGTYEGTNVVMLDGDNAKVYLHKNVNIQGKVNARKGNLYVNGSASITDLQITGGKMTIAEGWSGTITSLTVPAADISNNLISASRVTVEGDFTGTVTLSDGRVAVKEGNQLKVTAAPAGELVLDGSNMGFCEACNATVQWTQFTQRVSNVQSGHQHYYLAGNLTLNDLQWQPFGVQNAGSICFHFNGYTLTTNTRIFQTGTGRINLITENGGWVCTGIMPAAYAGAADTGVGKGLVVNSTGGIAIYGGTYTSQLSTVPLVYVAGGPIILKDATLNGFAQFAANANVKANIELKGSTTISGGVQWLGANGKITVDSSWTGSATLTLPDGAVENSVVKAAYGVANGDFTGTLKLTTGEKLVNDNGSLKVVAAEPENTLELDGNNMGFCEACNATVQWTQFTQRVPNIHSGHNHYYLAGDLTLNDQRWQPFGVQTEGSICFHFNGYTLTSNSRIFQTGTGSINLITKNGGWVCTGVVPADYASEDNGIGKGLSAAGAGGINVYGGTYTFQPGEGVATLPLLYVAGGPIVLKDATINGCGEIVSSANSNLVLKGSTTIRDNVQWLGVNGKITIDSSWTGSATLTLPDGAVENGVVKAAYGVANGDFTGTLKLSTGEKLVNDNGSLKVERTDPVWGVFEPWNYGGRAYCEACGQEAGIKTWKVYNGEYAETILSEPEVTHHHYYLNADVNYETANYLQTYENICFHLNGHNITAAGASSVYPISCTQVLCMIGDGIVTGGSSSSADFGSVFHVNGGNASATLKIYGGTYKKPATSTNPMISVGSNGGRVYIYGGTFDVNGSSAAGERGNLLYVQGQTTNGTKPCLAVVEIHGGTFTGDSRIGSKDTSGNYPGAASLKVLGGNYDGKIAVTNATQATLGKNAVVKEISVTADSKLTVKANFTGKVAVSFEAALVDNKVPEANGVAEGAFTGLLNLTNGDALVADGTTLKVHANNAYLKDLQFTSGTTAYCPICNANVEWTDAATKSDKRLGYKADGEHYHFYLSEDMIGSESLQFAEIEGNTTYCFHLNGHNLTLSSRFKVGVGTANIMGRGNVVFEGDCVANNETNTVNYNLAGFQASNTSNLNVYGGNYSTAGAALADGKPMFLVSNSNAKLNLYDVSVTGPVQATHGNVTVDASASVDKLTVAANAKLSVAGTFTGSVVASFASGLVEDAVPAANGASTGAFTGSVTLLDGTILIGDNGKLIKKPATP